MIVDITTKLDKLYFLKGYLLYEKGKKRTVLEN